MADKSFFGRLRRLFSSTVVVRNVGGRKLKIADTDGIQSYGNVATNFLVDRYSRMHKGNPNNAVGYGDASGYQQRKVELYYDYEEMDNDPIISSALDVYSDESTMKNELGEILKITSDNDNIQKILHNLFYDIINIDFNLWPWVRNMVKYGDFFLKMDIAENYGITNVVPVSPYEMERIEGADEENPHSVHFKVNIPGHTTSMHTVGGAAKAQELQDYEVAHFRLLSDSNYLPYGKSMIENARNVWKSLSLMEDAMLVHRVVRAPEKRIFKLDIGNIPPNEVDNYMQQVINKMKKTPLIDEKTGNVNLKYNLQNINEDFYLPVRGGDSGTNIDNLPGMTYEATDDIEYLRNKMMAALKIPKAFLGYEEQVNAKATLAAEDVRFARTIERIQRIVESELTKIAIVHLYSQGFTNEELVNFNLSLTNSSTIYEQEKIELWDAKQNLATSMIDGNLASSDWIYKNVFGWTDEQIKDIRGGVVDDKKRRFRYEQIESEGNDPIKSQQSFGTAHDLASIQQQEGGGDEQPFGEQDEGGAPEGGFEGAGRPKEIPKYGKDFSARGRDPLGKKDISSSLSMENIKKLTKDIPIKGKDKKVLIETLETEEEYKDYITNNDNNDDK